VAAGGEFQRGKCLAGDEQVVQLRLHAVVAAEIAACIQVQHQLCQLHVGDGDIGAIDAAFDSQCRQGATKAKIGVDAAARIGQEGGGVGQGGAQPGIDVVADATIDAQPVLTQADIQIGVGAVV